MNNYPMPSRVPLPTFRPDREQLAMTPGAASQPQRRGLLDFVTENPEFFLSMGAGLLGGRTGPEQWSGGLSAAAQTLGAAKEKAKEEKKKNATLEWLQKNAPDYAGAVEAGALTAADAYKMKVEAEKPKKPNFMSVGGHVFNENTGEWLSPPNAGEKPMSDVGKIMQDFNNGLIDEATRDALLRKKTMSDGMEIVSDGQGGFSLRQGEGVGGGQTRMRESEAKANIFASRGEAANAILMRLESEGTSLGNKITSSIPVIGNYGISPEYRQYDQAKRDFINAILRQESGAVIADSEFANAEIQYFPQPGDDNATIRQKRRNRDIAIKSIREASNRPSKYNGGAGVNGVTSSNVTWSVKGS